jgi:hypothetical protein
MLFFISLIPATLFITVGYFVLFSSTRAERGVKQFGNVLAVWMFILAGAVVVGGLVAPAMGFRGPVAGFAQHMQQMQEVQEELLQELQKD